MALSNTESSIISHKGRLWNLYRKVLIPVDPPHISHAITRDECRELIALCNPYFIRWTSNWDCRQETGFWYIIKEGSEDLETYSSKTRNTLRKGIRNFHAEIIPKEMLKSAGYDVYVKAFERYNTHDRPLTREDFIRQLDGLFRIGEWEFWGVFENSSGTLAGYSMNWIFDGACEYKTIKTDPAYMKDSSNYLLIHAMNHHYLDERKFRYVNDGSRSLRHESNIQGFLQEKFLFRKAFCRMHIHYRPWVAAGVKALYPVRHLFFASSSGLAEKASTLLKHEEILRSSMKPDKN